jgi:transglutaminase-like putative cysteine protease
MILQAGMGTMTSRGSDRILFHARLVLYLVAVSVPVFHPAIVVPYDIPGWYLWFFCVPAQMVLAFHCRLHGFRTWTNIMLFGIPPAVSILVGMLYGVSFFPLLGIGAAAFLSTFIIFRSQGHGRLLAMTEPLLLSGYYYRLIGYTRASEMVALSGSRITSILFVLALASLVLHGFIVYLALFQERLNRKNSREFLVVAAVMAFLGLMLSVFLSPDFIAHNPVFNELSEPLRPDLIPLDDSSSSDRTGGTLPSDLEAATDEDKGAVQEGGRFNDSGDMKSGNRNKLAGIPSDLWGNRSGDPADEKQYAVMIIASGTEPVYAAEAYKEIIHPRNGFVQSGETILNLLTRQRLIDIWKHPSPAPDSKRLPADIFYISTIQERVLAFEPRKIQPTVFNRRFHPFDYSYQAESAISIADEQDWSAIQGLSARERLELASFLEVDVPEEYRSVFFSYLHDILEGKEGYYQKIARILQGFSGFQYELGFTEDVSIKHIARFLGEDRIGDCTEFSNSTAILARLAGIPSRVVTGYLASRGLQKEVHRRGLANLRQALEPLQKFPMDELYLVTTAHHHSWVQLYMPGFGWVDFETTSYAQPPLGGDSLASKQLVIPIIQLSAEDPSRFRFPWLLLLRALALVAGSLVLAAYAVRYLMEFLLARRSKIQDGRGLDALYRLLLIRLAAEGRTIKVPSKTVNEYAQDYPYISSFARQYTLLRFKERYAPGEKEAAWESIRLDHSQALNLARRPGFSGTIKRALSLRGLYYL